MSKTPEQYVEYALKHFSEHHKTAGRIVQELRAAGWLREANEIPALVALKGDPDSRSLHDWSDLPKVANALRAELADLRERAGRLYADVRRRAKGDVLPFTSITGCVRCGKTWMLDEDESHAPDCIAAPGFLSAPLDDSALREMVEKAVCAGVEAAMNEPDFPPCRFRNERGAGCLSMEPGVSTKCAVEDLKAATDAIVARVLGEAS